MADNLTPEFKAAQCALWNFQQSNKKFVDEYLRLINNMDRARKQMQEHHLRGFTPGQYVSENTPAVLVKYRPRLKVAA